MKPIQGGNEKMKKTILLLVALALIVPMAFAAGTTEKKPVKIAYFVSTLSNGFHQAQANWAVKYAKERYNADVQVFDGKSDNATMIANIDQVVAQGFNMASLHVWQAEAAKPGIEAAIKKGIAMNTYFETQLVQIPVMRPGEAQISEEMGKIAAQQWKKAFPDKPIVFVELGWPDNEAVAEGRTVPFAKGVKSVDAGATDLGCFDCSKGADVAKKTIQDLVQAHPEINIIYSESADLTVGTLPGLQQVGRGKMKNAVPLTEILCSVDAPDTELIAIYDPSSSLKMSMALPPRETGMARIDNLFAIRDGKIKQVDAANKAPVFIPNTLIGYWSMTAAEAEKWYNEENSGNLKIPSYK
jgi:ABC-type sugar transport system substrate-binding protein